MRLVWLELNRYGRFESASLNLDARVIALLGANEAGKTTVLRALADLAHSDGVDPRSVTRGIGAPSGPICAAWFLLDADERAQLAEAIPEASGCRWYVLEKAVAGERIHRLEPRPRRDVARRGAVAALIEKIACTKWAGLEQQEDLRATIEAVRPVLASSARALEADSIAALKALEETLRRDDDAAPKRREKAIDELVSLTAYEELDHPADRALALVSPWQPDLLMFDGEARVLDSEYDLAAIAHNPPAALRNLATISGLDLSALRDAATSARPEVAEDLTEGANARLRGIFLEAWGQSEVEVRFGTDSTVLHLMVRSDQGALHRIAERSDGLKIFVALISFLVANGAHRPVLLVDEAEQHLHWDAQADLVGMLHRQEQVAQVVYTTHSPGCLPQDLGAGIRLVMQWENESDRSRAVNSIWTEGPGFVPLLMGIGASTAAITPARRALVAEGATEFLLLPALLREANGLDFLEFQVIPGLAEAGDTDLFDLDLAAARVAYFTDGDASGTMLRSRLLARGVDDSRAIALPAGMVIEDVVDAGALCEAIGEELRRSGSDQPLPFTSAALPIAGRAKWIEHKLRTAGLTPPPKPKVAARVLELGSPSKSGSGERTRIVEASRRRILATVLKRVHVALDVAAG
jgi:energy-coupling factor transporter ATP-binding protein EcfA2